MNIFEITIQRQWQADTWPVVVKRTSSGNLLPKHTTGTLHFSKDDFLKLTQLRHQPKKYGTLLGKALFQEDIRDAFIEAINSRTDNSQVRVLFSVEAKDLKFLHWHWLCIPSKWDFIALNQRILFSFYIPSHADRRFPPIGRKDLRALIFVANPEYLSSYNLHPFNATETVESIQNALGNIPSDVLALTPEAVGIPTLDQLCGQLTQQNYTLLHIVCHGQFRDTETWLYWSGDDNQVEPVAAQHLIERLDRLGEQRGLPHFIFLSACESAVPEADQTEAALGGLGQRLVRDLGIPAVIAMTQKITIKTAGLLSAEFYQRLYEHGEVDLSLVEATTTLADRHDILVTALFSRLGGQPLFSDSLDREPTNLEIEQGLSRLEAVLPQQAPILQDKFNQLQNTLEKTLNTNPDILSDTAKEERQNALQELNTLCTKAIEISFNALALGESPPEYDARCPFKGLYPFRSEDQEFFFGRNELIQQLQQKLEQHNFLAVLGMSGSGKSSVVLAGLIPALGLDPKSQVAYLTPSNNPVEQLDASLSKTPEQQLVVVDQFEELFTLCNDENSRVEFINRLIELIQNQKVIITMRADFWGECAPYVQLKELMEAQQLLIAPMNSQELKQAIERQAEQVGLRFAEGLSDSILDDVQTEPGAMPLLQHALWELWKRRHGRWLLYQEYEEIGTVKEAIARTADEFYNRLSAQEKQQVKDIFLRLTRLDNSHINYQERLDTRRRVEMEKLVPVGEDIAVIKDLVRRLANEDARLVVTSRNSVSGKEEVEVTHEALIRHWSKLQEWLNTNRNDLQIRERIRLQAEEWKQELKEEFLLLQGGRLEDAEGLLCQNPQFFNQQEADYIQACSAFRQRKQRQEVQKLRRWVSALTVALVVAVGSGLFALRQATIANLRLDAATVEDLLESDPVEGLILAIKATGESRRKLGRVLPEVQASLYAAIDVPVETHVFKGNGQPVNAVAFSPDGKIIASGREDGTIELLYPDGNPVISPFKGENGGVWSLAFSPDGKTIASGYEDGTIKLWDLQARLIVPPLKGHESNVWSLAFSPDGKIIASGSYDKTMRIWTISGQSIGEPLKHEQDVISVAFSPDGKIIASGSFDKKLRLWNLQDQVVSPIGSPLSSPQAIRALAFSPDHQIIATGHSDGTIIFFNFQSLKVEKTFSAHDQIISSIVFSPDGSQLMSGSWDNTIRFWDRQGNLISQPLRGHRRFIRSVAYNPDGKTVISGSVDGTVRLWKQKDNSTFEQSQKSAVRSLAVSPDEAMIISGSEDGKVYLWNMREKKLMIPPLEAHKERVTSLAFSPDGMMFVSGSNDKTLQLWDTQGKPIPPAFPEQTDYVTAVTFSPNSQMIASGTWDGKISLWNLQGQAIFSSVQAHRDVVTSVAFSPDRKTIASASWDGTIRLSDLNGNLVNSFSTQHGVYTLAFDSRNQILVTGHADGSVQLWNLEGEKPKHQNSLIAHQEAVTSVAFNEHSQLGKIIVSSSRDNRLRFWDLQGNKIGECIHPDDVLSFVIIPNGQTIVTGTEDGNLYLWPGGDWITWLNIGCNKLRDYPSFLLDAESSNTARKTCQDYELETR